VAFKGHRGATDPDNEVEFRETIASTIPSFIKMLFDSVDAIGNLANHGE
jgi:hypothetical protein